MAARTIQAQAAPAAGRKLLGQGSVYAVATVAPILVTLGLTPVLTRLLGPFEYGLVGVSITLYQLGAVLLGLGFPAAITRHAIVEKSGLAGARGIAAASALLAVLLAAVLIGAAPLWSPLMMPEGHHGLVVWPVVSAVGLTALTASQSMFRAAENVRAFTAFAALSAVAPLGLGLLSVWQSDATAANYLPFVAAGHLAVGALSMLWACRGSKLRITLHETVAAFRVGLPTVPHQVASSLLLVVLVAVTVASSGVAAAGGLQLAITLGSTPMVLLAAVNNAWAPMIYRSPDAQRTALLGSTFRTVALLVLLLLAGFAVLGPPVIHLVGGPVADQPGVVQSAMMVAAATVAMTGYLVNTHLVFLSGRTGLLAVTTPLAAAAAVALAAMVAAQPGSALWAVAAAVPAFHLCQSMWSIWLRRRTGLPMAPTLGGVLTLSLGLPPLAVSAVTGDIVLTLAFSVAAFALALLLNRRHLAAHVRTSGAA